MEANMNEYFNSVCECADWKTKSTYILLTNQGALWDMSRLSISGLKPGTDSEVAVSLMFCSNCTWHVAHFWPETLVRPLSNSFMCCSNCCYWHVTQFLDWNRTETPVSLLHVLFKLLLTCDQNLSQVLLCSDICDTIFGLKCFVLVLSVTVKVIKFDKQQLRKYFRCVTLK